MSTAEHDRHLAYVADLWETAFRSSRLVGGTTAETCRRAALAAGARIASTDQIGADLGTVQDLATATLIGQDFRSSAVALFCDDLHVECAAKARELRTEVGL